MKNNKRFKIFQILLNFFSRLIFQWTWLILAFIILGSLLLRLWHLGTINEEIFDEVYFVTFAKNYLSGTNFFDIHPPLGKLILALGLKIFGANDFGSRIMPAIFGTALIPLSYLTAYTFVNPSSKRELKKAKIIGLVLALIIALDGMILVYSRVGLIDIFMIFFILLGFYSILKFSRTQKLLFLILAGLCLGLAASVKYIAGLLFFAFVLIIIVKKIPLKKNLIKFTGFLIIFPCLIYLSFFLFNFAFNKNFFHQVYQWHCQSLNYNITLKETHPYGSKWWSWFLLLRPIWLYFKELDGKYIGINGMGNPLAWWSALIIIPLLIKDVARRNHHSLIILGIFLIFLLPWAFFQRVLFYYHALPSFIFLSLGTSYYLEKLLQNTWGKFIFTSYLVILLILFGYFLPIWIGLPISPDSFYHRMWFKSWI